ncbi:MAG: flagellar FlbD family protein [Planctomycetes bacterium]|nr:flagellar FlbD family protein [Planctomycetota bacterium]
MIRLTRLNNAEFILNANLIKFIEMRPDTIITLINEEKVMIRETMEEVVERVIEYERKMRLFNR